MTIPIGSEAAANRIVQARRAAEKGLRETVDTRAGAALGVVLVNLKHVGPVNYPDQEKPELSHRELVCLHLMAEGWSGRAIARKLYLSEDTVKTHLHRLYHKIGARERAHAVAIGFKTGLLPMSPPQV